MSTSFGFQGPDSPLRGDVGLPPQDRPVNRGEPVERPRGRHFPGGEVDIGVILEGESEKFGVKPVSVTAPRAGVRPIGYLVTATWSTPFKTSVSGEAFAVMLGVLGARVQRPDDLVAYLNSRPAIRVGATVRYISLMVPGASGTAEDWTSMKTIWNGRVTPETFSEVLRRMGIPTAVVDYLGPGGGGLAGPQD